MVGRARTAGFGLDGVLAEHHDELGVHDVRGVVGVAHAVEVGQRGRDLGGAVRAVASQAAAVHVDEAAEEPADVRGVHAARVVVPDGLGAVLVEDAGVVVGDHLVGLFPGDLLELALAALAHALHGVAQAVGVVEPAADRAAAQAGADLVIAELVVAGVVALDPGDLVVLDVQAQGAAALAVDRAVPPDDRLVGSALLGGRLVCVGVLAEERRGPARRRGGAQPGQRRSLDEAAARERRANRCLCHSPLLFSLYLTVAPTGRGGVAAGPQGLAGRAPRCALRCHLYAPALAPCHTICGNGGEDAGRQCTQSPTAGAAGRRAQRCGIMVGWTRAAAWSGGGTWERSVRRAC